MLRAAPRKLRKLWERLGETEAMKKLSHKECLMKLGAARKAAGRAWNLVEVTTVEEAFRNLKGDLSIRPVYHQKEDRIEAHPPSLKLWRPGIFIGFLSYCLHVTMRQQLRALAGGLTPRELLMKFSAIQMLDVHLPTTDGRTVEMTRYTQPNRDQKLLVSQLILTLPPQSPPKIYAKKEQPSS